MVGVMVPRDHPEISFFEVVPRAHPEISFHENKKTAPERGFPCCVDRMHYLSVCLVSRPALIFK